MFLAKCYRSSIITIHPSELAEHLHHHHGHHSPQHILQDDSHHRYTYYQAPFFRAQCKGSLATTILLRSWEALQQTARGFPQPSYSITIVVSVVQGESHDGHCSQRSASRVTDPLDTFSIASVLRQTVQGESHHTSALLV